jgi:hypothetical protein
MLTKIEDSFLAKMAQSAAFEQARKAAEANPFDTDAWSYILEETKVVLKLSNPAF